MTNKLEISPNLLDKILRLMGTTEGRRQIRAEVNAILAAPVVERQCCTPTPEEEQLLANGDYTPEELWGGSRPTCPKCLNTSQGAPVVERQDDALSKGFYTTQTGGGKYEINIGYRTIDELHAADEQLRDLLKSRTSQLAPVAVVLPTPISSEDGPHYSDNRASELGYLAGYNACLDKVKELNQ